MFISLKHPSVAFGVLTAVALLGAGSHLLAQELEQPLELVFERPFFSLTEAPTERLSGSAFDIVLEFDPVNTPTLSQQAIFALAEAAWESRISAYLPGINVPAVTIVAGAPAIDGVGGILGSAGPTFGTEQAGHILTTDGEMSFDSADLGNLEAGGSLGAVIEHEMGHVLGIGTLWGFGPHTHYVDNSFEYTGPAGVAIWTDPSEYGQTGTVDVENEGGAGTANGHWNEVVGGSALVGITDGQGRDMRNALMTGWLNFPTFYSSLTHAHLEDLGFVTFPFNAYGLFENAWESGDLAGWSSVVD